MKFQPPVVTGAPDSNQVSVMVANSVVSIAARAVVLSCRRYGSLQGLVPPT